MAQNDRAAEYVNFKQANFCPDSDSSDIDSYSDTDSDGDSYSGWLCFNLWLGFVIAQNDRSGEYVNFK